MSNAASRAQSFWGEWGNRPRWWFALDAAKGGSVMGLAIGFTLGTLFGKDLGPCEVAPLQGLLTGLELGLVAAAYGTVVGFLLKFA